jgi:hypothetical protein
MPTSAKNTIRLPRPAPLASANYLEKSHMSNESVGPRHRFIETRSWFATEETPTASIRYDDGAVREFALAGAGM